MQSSARERPTVALPWMQRGLLMSPAQVLMRRFHVLRASGF
jgi:hypothetical protein